MVVTAVKAIILKLVYGVDLTENNLQTKRGRDKFAGQSFRTVVCFRKPCQHHRLMIAL